MTQTDLVFAALLALGFAWLAPDLIGSLASWWRDRRDARRQTVTGRLREFQRRGR